MYEYMLYWRRNDWVNQKTESNYLLPINLLACIDCDDAVSYVLLV